MPCLRRQPSFAAAQAGHGLKPHALVATRSTLTGEHLAAYVGAGA